MHVHILGICGTFMGSLAVLAKQLGHQVSGSDANVYPPMSTQLQEQGIALMEGFKAEHLQPHPDIVIIGNAMSRGNPAVEYVLDEGLSYTSGPQWLAQYVLHQRWVLGVAGTHGKTTTSAMLAWILEYAGLQPGYLIGGVSKNFPSSATLGGSPFFVVEADEYDSAFFDKRSKFVHYAPRTAILNNLEYDHADIFDNLEAIQTQFHHLVRTIPSTGLILAPNGETALETVLARGCWTPVQRFSIGREEAACRQEAKDSVVLWNATLSNPQGSDFELVKYAAGEGQFRASVTWQLTGMHNVKNALAAVAAAHHVGVEVATAAAALQEFLGVKRRLELRGEVDGIRVYDDFAHHPTAIELTLQGVAARLQAEGSTGRLIAVIEPRSNTMNLGIHQHTLTTAIAPASLVVWQKPAKTGLDFERLITESKVPGHVFNSAAEIIAFLKDTAHHGDTIVIMSNGGFEGIHEKLLSALRRIN